jgi:hypothetical protein
VDDDVIKDAWAVNGCSHEMFTPIGKSRPVSRSTFDTAEDPRLAPPIGQPSPLGRRRHPQSAIRNPQSTIRLADLPAAAPLLADPPTRAGQTRPAECVLTVTKTGRIEVRRPDGATLTWEGDTLAVTR